jgi:hypothetical protein
MTLTMCPKQTGFDSCLVLVEMQPIETHVMKVTHVVSKRKYLMYFNHRSRR